jgi:hypothetical protein
MTRLLKIFYTKSDEHLQCIPVILIPCLSYFLRMIILPPFPHISHSILAQTEMNATANDTYCTLHYKIRMFELPRSRVRCKYGGTFCSTDIPFSPISSPLRKTWSQSSIFPIRNWTLSLIRASTLMDDGISTLIRVPGETVMFQDENVNVLVFLYLCCCKKLFF